MPSAQLWQQTLGWTDVGVGSQRQDRLFCWISKQFQFSVLAASRKQIQLLLNTINFALKRWLGTVTKRLAYEARCSRFDSGSRLIRFNRSPAVHVLIIQRLGPSPTQMMLASKLQCGRNFACGVNVPAKLEGGGPPTITMRGGISMLILCKQKYPPICSGGALH